MLGKWVLGPLTSPPSSQSAGFPCEAGISATSLPIYWPCHAVNRPSVDSELGHSSGASPLPSNLAFAPPPNQSTTHSVRVALLLHHPSKCQLHESRPCLTIAGFVSSTQSRAWPTVRVQKCLFNRKVRGGTDPCDSFPGDPAPSLAPRAGTRASCVPIATWDSFHTAQITVTAFARMPVNRMYVFVSSFRDGAVPQLPPNLSGLQEHTFLLLMCL